MVLAAAVESIVDVFRALLAKLGFKFVRSKMGLDEAIAVLDEFAPKNEKLLAKIEASKLVVRQIENDGQGRIAA